MRVGLSTNSVSSCQPLRFGKKSEARAESQHKTPAQYEKEIAMLQMKYELACNFAALQTDQFNKTCCESKK